MLQTAEFEEVIGLLTDLPPHVCCNEMIVSPTRNRAYLVRKSV